jgi:hypothetical protein
LARSIKRVCAKELRKKFNDGRFWERAQEGEFEERFDRSEPISPRKRKKLDMPGGSQSQTVAYLSADGKKVALVHQYVRPNGAVRGKPDPKYLKLDGQIYCLHVKPPECAELASTEKG